MVRDKVNDDKIIRLVDITSFTMPSLENRMKNNFGNLKIYWNNYQDNFNSFRKKFTRIILRITQIITLANLKLSKKIW